jgi:RIO kinase 1
MILENHLSQALEPLFDRGLILELLQELKSGKEATVYLCRAGPRVGKPHLAVKVYRPIEHRNFRNDSAYRDGVPILKARVRRAVENRSDFGKEAAFGMWVGREWGFLNELHSLGLDVPRPIHFTGTALAMQFLGNGDVPAPQLRSVKLDENEALRTWHRLTAAIRTLLANNRIHGDLSPYNLLWHEGKAWIIDLPQMVDPRENSNAYAILSRDIENVWRYLSKFAPLPDPWKLAGSLWHRWRLSQL